MKGANLYISIIEELTRQTYQILMNRALAFCVLFTVLLTGSVMRGQTCATDAGCDICSFYFALINLSIVGYFQCDKCYPNHTANQTTGNCDCSPGFYVSQSNASQCSTCPALCVTCSNGNSCTACRNEYFRVLEKSGQCVCMDGYQSKNGALLCTKKINVLVVVLSSVGSVVFCLIIGLICYKICSMRNKADQKIYDMSANPIHRPDQCQIQPYQQPNQSPVMMQNTSSYWSLQHEYKAGELCSICLDAYPLFLTVCGHYFHAKCIYGWLDNHNICPNCNKQIDARAIRRWCSRCRRVLMPVIKAVNVKKVSKSKKQLTKNSAPMEFQICDECEMAVNEEYNEKQNKDMAQGKKEGKELFT